MEGKDRSLISIVARTGLLAFIAVFVVLIQAVSSAVVLPEANNMTLAVEYYDKARRIFFASLALSGVNIIYALTFVNRKSLARA
jgi:hypothetical protein